MCTCFSVLYFAKRRVRFVQRKSFLFARSPRLSVDRGVVSRVAGAIARRALHACTQVNRRQGVCSTAPLEAHARCRTSGRPPPRSPPPRTDPSRTSLGGRVKGRAQSSTWRTTPAPRWPLWPRATRNLGCVLSPITRDCRAAAIPRGASSRASRAPARVSRFSSPPQETRSRVRFPRAPPAVAHLSCPSSPSVLRSRVSFPTRHPPQKSPVEQENVMDGRVNFSQPVPDVEPHERRPLVRQATGTG